MAGTQKFYLIVCILFSFTHCSSVHHGPSGEALPQLDEKGEPKKQVNVKDYLLNPATLQEESKEEVKIRTPKRILVLPFINRSPYGGEELAKEVARSVQEETSKIEAYQIVPLNDIEGRDTFIVEGEYFLRSIFEKARVFGIQGVILGVIDDILFRERGDEVGLFRSRFHTASVSIKFQFYDVATQKELYSRLITEEVTEEFTSFFGSEKPHEYNMGRAQSAINKIVDQFSLQIPNIAKRIAWSGQIVRIDLHRYYIDAGEASGLARGQLLSVFSQGEHVKDPKSGQEMGTIPGRYKGTLQIIDYVGKDLAVAVAFSGANFKEKDRVELLYAHKDH